MIVPLFYVCEILLYDSECVMIIEIKNFLK